MTSTEKSPIETTAALLGAVGSLLIWGVLLVIFAFVAWAVLS